MGWSVALALYVLPILVGIRHFDEEVENCREWMRSDEGEWFPALAALGLIAWPFLLAIEAIMPRPPK